MYLYNEKCLTYCPYGTILNKENDKCIDENTIKLYLQFQDQYFLIFLI